MKRKPALKCSGDEERGSTAAISASVLEKFRTCRILLHSSLIQEREKRAQSVEVKGQMKAHISEVRRRATARKKGLDF